MYFNKTLSWLAARRKCQEEYGGYLASIDIEDEEDVSHLKSCMEPGDNAWFGNYSVMSSWIAIYGMSAT